VVNAEGHQILSEHLPLSLMSGLQVQVKLPFSEKTGNLSSNIKKNKKPFVGSL